MKISYSKLCKGSYQKMERFLEVCLLILLYKESCHGYGLMNQLGDFGFIEENLNISTLYRTLRKMEEDDLVVSTWEEGMQGPQRRVYNITDAGKQELENWVEILKLKKERINNLINSYEKVVQIIN